MLLDTEEWGYTVNSLLKQYFEGLEDYLIAGIQLAGDSATAQSPRGQGGASHLARVLGSHLPARARLAVERQIIGADTTERNAALTSKHFNFNGKKERNLDAGPSNPIDVIVYNEWTANPSLLEAGYLLAESVYLAIEVKCRQSDKLLAAIVKEASRQLALAKVVKYLRPETTYFGNLRKSMELSVRSTRASRPTTCVVGIVWDGKTSDHVSLDDLLPKLVAEVK